MPRKAREKKLYSFYQVNQSCKVNSEIFKSDYDRKILIKAFLSAKEKHNYKLMGLTINDNGYQMILYDNGSDITKIMRSINISFAMNYKCKHESCDVVFRERYKSKILSKEEVKIALKTLPKCKHLNPEWLDIVDIETCNATGCIDCLDKAKGKIELMASEVDLTYEEMLSNKKVRNNIIKTLRKDSTLNLTEIGSLFGGLSESAVSKILSR